MQKLNNRGDLTLLFSIYVGVSFTLLGGLTYRALHVQAGWAAPITFAQCEKMYAKKGGFDRATIDRLCSL